MNDRVNLLTWWNIKVIKNDSKSLLQNEKMEHI